MKALSIALVAAAGLVPALGFSQTIVIQPTPVTSGPVSYGSSVTLNLPKFDATQEYAGYSDLRISSATISVTWSSPAFNSIYSVAGIATFNGVAFDPSFYSAITTGGATTLTWLDATALDIAAINGTPGSVSLNSFDGRNTQTVAFTADSKTISGPIGTGDFSLFTFSGTGSNTVSLGFSPWYAYTAQETSTSGTFSQTAPGQTVFTATVTYTVIPEPSTYAVILGAFTLGLVGWRRSRK